MSFFRRKRPTVLSHEPPSTNGAVKATTPTPTGNPVFLPPVHPPLENFVGPSDENFNAIVKAEARNTTDVDEVLSWAKEYFVFFLRGEDAEDIIDLYERIKTLKASAKNGPTERCNGEDNGGEYNISELKHKIKKFNQGSNIFTNSVETEVSQTPFEWLEGAEKEIRELLQQEYLPKFLNSKFYIKCQVDFFTNSEIVTLRDILGNPTSLFYFMEYVDQENKREVLEFWLGATNFVEQFSSTEYEKSFIDIKTAQKDAMVLYEKYISLQAPHFLGFRDEIRCEVERLICSQDEIAHCFDRTIDEALMFLHVTCMEGFLKSSLFLAFLSELINSLSPPQKTHRRSESTSTCSSSSVSLTSPVINPSNSHKQAKSKLSLGRVTSIGKFEAETDLELLKHDTGIAKNLVKKLVNFDEKEKAKEELAWQVAEMIVNEVTSITMGTGEASNIIND